MFGNEYRMQDMVAGGDGVFGFFYVHIKSKAGEQYLDSLDGSNTVEKEGSYKKSKFLVCVKNNSTS